MQNSMLYTFNQNIPQEWKQNKKTGLGRCYGMDAIPGLGTSTSHSHGKKKKKVTIKWNPKWMENLHLHKTYTWLLRTVIFTISPSQKQTKCSSNGEWTHQRMEHPHKEIPVSNKRQQIIDTCNHMAFQMHYAVWKESGSRGYTVWFPLYGIWKNESYGDRVITKGYGWGKGLTIKGDRQAIFFAIVVYLECGGSYMPPCIC